jgi:small neutral amino acid transporter SnatA (MarC family)
MFGINNWKTTAAGTAALFSAIAGALVSYSRGVQIDWTSVMGGFYMFWIGITAKDANVTGGTVPQTPEAEVRVQAPEVITDAPGPLPHPRQLQ